MKRVILLSHFFPFPAQVGAQTRISIIIKALSSLTEIVLIAQESGEEDIEEAKKYCREIFLLKKPSDNSLTRLLRRLKEPFDFFPAAGRHLNINGFKEILYSLSSKYDSDVIWLEALWLIKSLKDEEKRKIVIDQHNIDSLVIEKRFKNAHFPLNLLFYNDFIKQRRFEQKNIKKAEKIFSVSLEEKEKHKELFGDLNIEVLPNCVEIEKYPLLFPNSSEKAIAMTGDFGYAPNVEGFYFFTDKIFENIKREIFDVKLIVGGRKSKNLKTKNQNIFLYGEFDKPQEIFQKTSVSIAPILTGGGSRYKIIESLSFGIPVVSTPEGAEGLNISEEEGLFIAKSEKDFAEKTVELIKNRELARESGKKGRKAIENRYSFKAFQKSLENTVADILN